MAITDDTKDWTWVLERACPDCGVDVSRIEPADYGATVRSVLEPWRRALERPDAAIRLREDRWSTLEYGCHVRDVFRVFSERVRALHDGTDVRFANWDQDATARDDHYDRQDPVTVATELREAGEVLAALYDATTPEQWRHEAIRGETSRFTLATLGRYMMHDPLHHLWDVGSSKTNDEPGA